MIPTVFVSYSHDHEDHIAWVLQLATRLRHNGVNAILDQWNLDLGRDVAAFIERGLSESNRVVCICSENYVRSANEKRGGVGYEKRMISAEIMSDANTDWVIPVIRNNASPELVPTFLSGCLYVDFRDDVTYEEKYEQLLRSLLNEPILPGSSNGQESFRDNKRFCKSEVPAEFGKVCLPLAQGTRNVRLLKQQWTVLHW